MKKKFILIIIISLFILGLSMTPSKVFENLGNELSENLDISFKLDFVDNLYAGVAHWQGIQWMVTSFKTFNQVIENTITAIKNIPKDDATLQGTEGSLKYKLTTISEGDYYRKLELWNASTNAKIMEYKYAESNKGEMILKPNALDSSVYTDTALIGKAAYDHTTNLGRTMTVSINQTKAYDSSNKRYTAEKSTMKLWEKDNYLNLSGTFVEGQAIVEYSGVTGNSSGVNDAYIVLGRVNISDADKKATALCGLVDETETDTSKYLTLFGDEASATFNSSIFNSQDDDGWIADGLLDSSTYFTSGGYPTPTDVKTIEKILISDVSALSISFEDTADATF